MHSVLLALLFAQQATVTHVVDGDTLKVQYSSPNVSKQRQPITVRILGIDCPESHVNPKCTKTRDCSTQIPKGKAAARRTVELSKGLVVTLEGSSKLDRFKRVLAYVRLPDGTDLGLALIREGLCADYSAKYPHPRQDEYRK